MNMWIVWILVLTAVVFCDNSFLLEEKSEQLFDDNKNISVVFDSSFFSYKVHNPADAPVKSSIPRGELYRLTKQLVIEMCKNRYISVSIDSVQTEKKGTLTFLIKKITLRKDITQKKGWRNNNSTAGPVEYRSSAKIVMEVFDETGLLLYRGIHEDSKRKKVFQNLFKRAQKKKRKTLPAVVYAQKFYAEPIVKVAYGALKKVFEFSDGK